MLSKIVGIIRGTSDRGLRIWGQSESFEPGFLVIHCFNIDIEDYKLHNLTFNYTKCINSHRLHS